MISNLIRLIPQGYRGSLISYVVLSLVSVCLRAAGALLLVPLLGALFGSRPADSLSWLGALTAVTVVGWFVDFALARNGHRIGFALLNDSQHRVADQLTHIPLGWFTAQNTATARQAIASGGPELVGVVVNLLTPLAGAILLPAVIAFGLFFISWKLALAAAISLPLLLGALAANNRIVRAAEKADAEANSALTERILEFARTQAALRASRRVGPTQSQVGTAVSTARGATLRLLLFQIPGQLLFSTVSQIALIVLAATVAVLAVRGEVGAPEAVGLMIVAVRFLEPFNVISELATAVESARGVLERLNIVIGADAEDEPGDAVASADTPAPRIEFQDVSFHYQAGNPRGGEACAAPVQVLQNLNIALEPGSTTAIVGPSGSGKSTILSLIAGLHRPTGGRILVDGNDIDDMDASSRRALVTMVFQHPYLFDDTIIGNVVAGYPGAGEKDARRAMSLARVDEITRRLPDAENSRVGEAGAALSGGERQRVSIARALVKPAPVLLVDEATSALDTENEAAVTEAVSGDPRIRTRVIVAHRLSAIRHADRVIFIEDGTIAEEGSVEELNALGGRFAEFWRQQESSSGWRIAAHAVE